MACAWCLLLLARLPLVCCTVVALHQVQAYRLAVEQRRNFELRIPCNIGGSHSIQHSSDQTESQAGSTSTTSNYSSSHAGFLSNSHATAPWGGVLPSSNLDSIGVNAERSERKTVMFAGGCNGAVEPSRRRSISVGGMRYVRFQFRSVSSVASHMAPAISIPPALMNRCGAVIAAFNIYVLAPPALAV